MPHADPAKRKEYQRQRYLRERERFLAYEAKHYADNADRIRGERMLKRTAERKAIAASSMRERHAALRIEMISAYGGLCVCCGEDEPKFLELDHVDSNGAAERRIIGRGSNTTYRALKKKGWPKDGYQLLCANCNAGKARNGGVCPHVRKADLIFRCDG